MTDYTGFALVVTSIMGPLVAILTLLINNRTVKKVHDVAKETLEVASQVDRAVNGKAPGEASLSEDVTTIKDKQEADNPSGIPEVRAGKVVVGGKVNGDASLRLQVKYLTRLVEEMSDMTLPPRARSKAKAKPRAVRRR